MFNKILVATDGSKHAEQAIRLASDIARLYDAAIHLVNVRSKGRVSPELVRLAEVEHLVVDGASPDGTAEVARGLGARVISRPDRGIYDAMNKGLARFQGDAFGFLNADDRYHGADALAKIAEGLSGAEMVSGNLEFVRAHDGADPVRVWKATQFRPGRFSHY